jgi:NADPH2:quinone reductase
LKVKDLQVHVSSITSILIVNPEGAAIPLAALTSALGLYARLRLPEPWLPASDDQKTPLVIYGASSAVGSYALQLAVKSNIHPIITIAGRAQDHVEKFIDRSKGDTIIDYRKGDEAVVKGLKEALNGQKLFHAFDAVSEKGSVENLAQVLDPMGAITFVLPGKEYKGFAETVNLSTTQVGDVHGAFKDFGYVHSRYLSKGLEDGWFKPQPQEIIPGGLEGVEKGLSNLKDGTVSAVKYIFKIEDTTGAGSGQ